MSETATLEPGGFLAELQRARCDGATAVTTFQGLVADEILVPQSVIEGGDAATIVGSVNAFTQTMLDQALFIAGEFAPEALWSFCAHDYVTQARDGGHAMYFTNRGGDEFMLRSASAGLKSMVADPHYELFTTMVRLKSLPPRAQRKLLQQKRWRSVEAAMRDLDKQLAALEESEPLVQRQRTWLRSLRKLKVVPDAEMGARVRELAALNHLADRRRVETDRARAEHEKSDPAHQSVKALCEMAGLRFVRLRESGLAQMRAIWADGPDRKTFAYRVETDRGLRVAAFYKEGGLFKRYLAVLLEQNTTLPLGSLTLTRAEFDRIAPRLK